MPVANRTRLPVTIKRSSLYVKVVVAGQRTYVTHAYTGYRPVSLSSTPGGGLEMTWRKTVSTEGLPDHVLGNSMSMAALASSPDEMVRPLREEPVA